MVLGAENHTIPILQKNFVDINKKLNLENIDAFFKGLLSMNAFEVHMKESPKCNKLPLEPSLSKLIDDSE